MAVPSTQTKGMRGMSKPPSVCSRVRGSKAPLWVRLYRESRRLRRRALLEQLDMLPDVGQLLRNLLKK